MLKVGTQVEVDSHGKGIIALDNQDGTWNVELDDGSEGDFETYKLKACKDQSLEQLSVPTAIVMDSGARIVRQPELEDKPKGWTRFVCFSDTHGKHELIAKQNYPQADVLLHAGDFTNTGELEEVESFAKWLSAYPAKHKIVVAGNHDITFHEEYYLDRGAARFHRQAVADPNTGEVNFKTKPYDCSKVRELLKGNGNIYLEDGIANICGYSIYGSPWQPEFCDWAFMLPRGQPMREIWAKVPESVDVLLTHTPPCGFGDRSSSLARVGCEMLTQAIQQRAVSVNVSGHIHSGYGWTSDDTTLYINASTCDRDYRPINPPVVFDLPPPDELRAATQQLAKARQKRQPSELKGGYAPRVLLQEV
eukprot:TRINITY_DN72744_c0_g1_i1.p1 TRINITY_DN72744_c0_g1~~TRINITY_DN72744_c0_g1_i1.p1  ORF type:complete len:363 (+),score=49.72 TRINITY_DN72744_c0_g1_i1:160-1248(+)